MRYNNNILLLGGFYLFDKLDFIENKYNELSQRVSDPQVIADTSLWSKLCKELSDITPVVEKYGYPCAMWLAVRPQVQ